jgi:hypothetical protein
VLVHDLPGQREELLGPAVLVLGSAGVGRGGRGQNVELVELRHTRVPIRHLPGQLGEVERLGGLTGEASAALVQQPPHQNRAPEAASCSRESARAIFRGESQKLLEIPLCATQVPLRRDHPSRNEEREHLQKAAPSGGFGSLPKCVRIGLDPAMRTTGS